MVAFRGFGPADFTALFNQTVSSALRILHVVPTYLPATRYGGPIRSVHGLCKALVERGHEVHVFTTNVDGPDVSPVRTGRAIELDGVNVWYFPTGVGRRLYRSPEMGAALNCQVGSFDLVHLHSVFLWPTTAAARSARRFGTPYVLSPRGMLVSDLIRRKRPLLKMAWINAFERENVAHATAVHATSAIEADELNRLGFTPRRVEIIPNGVELPEDASSPVELPIKGSRARVLSLGRISWKKGLSRLIQAMRYLPDVELVIAGNDDENYQPRLQQLAEECGVADRTIFEGPVLGAKKWSLFRSCDVFAMPSYSENFGIAALEAMACGCAVVMTKEVGLAQSVDRNCAGIIAAGEPVALASAIRQLIENPELRKTMGINGAKLASETYSWSAIAANMESLYDDLTRFQPKTAKMV